MQTLTFFYATDGKYTIRINICLIICMTSLAAMDNKKNFFFTWKFINETHFFSYILQETQNNFFWLLFFCTPLATTTELRDFDIW